VEDGLGHGAHELEDARVGPLVLAEGLVIHEEVDKVAVAVDVVDPLGELLGREGPLAPAAVAEAEGDIVGEAVVLEQEPERLAIGGNRPAGRRVDIAWLAEAEVVIPPLAADALEPGLAV